MSLRAAGLAGLLWLAGCATTTAPRVPLSPEAQAQLLRGLAGFELSGRAAVAAGTEGFNASVSWRQAGEGGTLRLSGPVGAGSISLSYAPGTLRVTGSRGEELEGADAEAAIEKQLGFLPPFESLRYWVLGLPAPGEPPSSLLEDDAGRPAELAQQQWRIRYDAWTGVRTREGLAQLPQRMTATREDLRLRLVVDRWKL